VAPLIDANWFGDQTVHASLRVLGQAWFEYWVSPNTASLLFGLTCLLLLFVILLFCHRRRWILKL
jgi:predicted acyltransferase